MSYNGNVYPVLKKKKGKNALVSNINCLHVKFLKYFFIKKMRECRTRTNLSYEWTIKSCLTHGWFSTSQPIYLKDLIKWAT